MSSNNLFEIPESGSDKPVVDPGSTRVYAHFVAPAPKVYAPAHSNAPRGEAGATGRGLSGGLEGRYEFTTGAGMRPRRVEETVLPEGHAGRARLGVMVAMIALIVFAVVGAAIAFAASR